jgi:hypothetical protein
MRRHLARLLAGAVAGWSTARCSSPLQCWQDLSPPALPGRIPCMKRRQGVRLSALLIRLNPRRCALRVLESVVRRLSEMPRISIEAPPFGTKCPASDF